MPSSLSWTGNKADLIEIIYALQTIGVFNKGEASIKEIATVFEKVFHIELGDYYRTFVEIRSRKINQVKFIENLKETLLKRMQYLDE